MPSKEMQTRTGKLVLMNAIALTGWFSLLLQLNILLQNATANGLSKGEATVRFFSYFTIQTNLLVAVSLTLQIFKPGSLAGRFFSRSATSTAIAVYILIVGLDYNTVLRFLWQPEGLQKWVDDG
jgi:hypothetical protein